MEARFPPVGLTRDLTEFWVIRRKNFAASIAYPLLRCSSPLHLVRTKEKGESTQRGLAEDERENALCE